LFFSLQDLFKKSKENHDVSLPSTSGVKDVHKASDSESDNSSTSCPKKRSASSETLKGLSKVSIPYLPCYGNSIAADWPNAAMHRLTIYSLLFKLSVLLGRERECGQSENMDNLRDFMEIWKCMHNLRFVSRTLTQKKKMKMLPGCC
jgi:hypothetical protein